MERGQAVLIVIIVISIVLALLSIGNILRKVLRTFCPFIHITCLVGCLIILTLSVLDLLVETKVVGLEFMSDFSSIYFLGTSVTSILSCYVLIQVGSNFYQDYSNLKSVLLFTPIVVSLGVFGMSVFIAIRIVLTNDDSVSVKDETKFVLITFILSAVSGVLSLVYGLLPLISIRSQTRLRPQQTAVSIVHYFIVVALFVAHFVVYTVITFNGTSLDLVSNSVENMILILIFPGSLIVPPKGMVKFIKRMVLGVEQLTIGGDYRPNMNMIPGNETNGSSSPIVTQTAISIPSSNDSNNDTSSSRASLSISFPVSHSVSMISAPTPTPRSTPNSASPKRNEPPLVKSRSLLFPRANVRTRQQSLPSSYKSSYSKQPTSQNYKQSQSQNYKQPQSQSQTYNTSQPQNYPKIYIPPPPPPLLPPQNYNLSQPQSYSYSYSNPPLPPQPQTYSYFINQSEPLSPLPPLPPIPPIPSSQSMLSTTSKTSSSIGSDASFYLSKFTNNTNNTSNGEGPSRRQQPQYLDSLRE